jgi:hypothetical protein
MAKIPEAINGVEVEFGEGVVNDVTDSLVNALQQCIRPYFPLVQTLRKIYISAAKDHHTAPNQVNSRHNQRKAVDISRLNDTKIAIGYPNNPAIRALVDAIQDSFEVYPGRRENFGPHLKKKLGTTWPVPGHDDHIHLSVN